MNKRIVVLLTLISVVALAGCASEDASKARFRVGKPYAINGKTYYPQESYTQEQTGIASWYGPGFHGKKTASGERFDQNELTAAHPTLQMPSLVRVTNLDNGRTIVVRVNDRGPFHANRVMDVSKGAAKLLGMLGTGTAKVKLQVLGPESIAVAEAAKRGVDTRGAELAMNNGGALDPRFSQYYPTGSTIAQGMAPVPQIPGVTVAENSIPAPVYQPQGAIEVAVAQQPNVPAVSGGQVNWNDQPVLAQPAVSSMPEPPMAPPQQAAVTYQPAIIQQRGVAGGPPGIPVATLQPGDIPLPIVQGPATAPVQGHYTNGTFYPDARVEILPVRPSQIYVQAGSFMSQSNAMRVQQQVAALGPSRVVSANVAGAAYYRVRIGPIESVDKADIVVNTLQRQGRQASIVVTEN